jgi:hypothetical protein
MNINSLVVVLPLLLFSCGNKKTPESEGKEAAELFCNCKQNYANHLIKIDGQFLGSFKPEKYHTRDEARNALYELRKTADIEYSECVASAEVHTTQIRNGYLTNKENIEQYDFAFNAINRSCLSPIPNNKATGPSITTSIALIPMPLPTLEQIKSDLLNKTIEFESQPKIAYKYQQYRDYDPITEIKIIESVMKGKKQDSWWITVYLKHQMDTGWIDVELYMIYARTSSFVIWNW